MKKRSHRRRYQRPQRSLNLSKHFKDGSLPDYKKWEVLSHFITERGKILPRSITGMDAKLQRRMTREVKRARHLALLPFTVKAL